MEDSPKLSLIFYSNNPKEKPFHSYKLSFEKPEDIPHLIINDIDTFELPKEIFILGEDQALIFLDLYDVSHKLIQTIKFEVHYSDNNIYIEKEESEQGYNFELVFKDFNDLDVNFRNQKFDKFDNVYTNDRKKITLLNYNSISVNINNCKVNIKKLIEECPNKSDFYRFSMNVNEKSHKIIVQPIKEFDKPELVLLMKEKSFIDIVYNELKLLIEKKEDPNYSNSFKEIVNFFHSNISQINYNLNTSRKYLSKYFSENAIELLTVYKYIILEIFKDDDNQKYSSNKELLKTIFFEMNKAYKKIETSRELEIYDKIILLKGLGHVYSFCNNLEELKSIDIQYFLISECEKNSIIDKARIMFDNFVLNLDENSKIFKYLLNLNAGVGFYNKEPVYTFDMTNKQMLKKHLIDIFPKFLIFYRRENEKLAETYKSLGWININLTNLEKLKEKEIKCEFNIDLKDEDLSNDLAIDIFNIILHEATGHKKFSFKFNRSKSPKNIINEQNELVPLKDIVTYISDEEDMGESGAFAELGLGAFNKNLITNMMYKLDNKGKLFHNINLFTSEDGEILKKYIILKSEIKEQSIKVNIKKEMTILEEIKEMEKYVDYQKVISKENEAQKEKENEKNEITILGKKTKRNKDNNDKGETKNYRINDLNYKNSKVFNMRKKNEPKGKHNNEEEEAENLVYKNDKEKFKILYKEIVDKYEFEDYNIIEKISQKRNDKNISKVERKKLNFVYEHLLAVS